MPISRRLIAVSATFALALGGALIAAVPAQAATSTINFTIADTDPLIASTAEGDEVPCVDARDGSFHYKTVQVVVDTTGDYTLVDNRDSDDNLVDGYAVIYDGAFNPADVLAGCLGAFDDNFVTPVGYAVTLTAGTHYTLFESTYDDEETGPVQFLADGPGTFAVVTETTTTLTSTPNPSDDPTAASFTATVTGSSPTGSVEFFEGTTLLGVAQVTAGAASLPLALPVGSHTLTAVYSGDLLNAPSTSAEYVQVVNPPAPVLAATGAGDFGTTGGIALAVLALGGMLLFASRRRTA
ncbi:MAG: hypothetical protein JWO10_288 [Microbacteriaceae bacterium]|nr:hypothetical protein [Microbacteriaceae bacterium]